MKETYKTSSTVIVRTEANMMPLLMAQMVLLCRSEGNWGEYGLSKAAVNCYTIELGKRCHATQELYL